MAKLPLLDKNVCNSPHIVILGAGGSKQTFPNGDANGKKLPLMNDLIEILGLAEILDKESIEYKNVNFEEIYSDLKNILKYQMLSKNIENRIYEYFKDMVIPNEPTIYDYLILSLREKDLIATFNWDPLLIQAYRRNIKIKKLPRPIFLHGNVGIGVCCEHKNISYIDAVCPTCNKPLSRVKLLYPIKQTNYSAEIKSEWYILENKLNVAYWFTIFGYGAPSTDVDAKNLMLKVWQNNPSRDLAEIEIIDIKPKDELKETWNSFIVRQHYGIYEDFFNSYLCRYPRRTCEALASATLMGNPWPENRFPKFNTLDELHKWIEPLLEDEIKYEVSKEPFSYMT